MWPKHPSHWATRCAYSQNIHRAVFAPKQVWPAFTTLTGFINGFRSLLLVRFLFRAGEAGAYANSSAVVARWFPVAERARAYSIVWMAGLLGAGFTPLIVVPS